MERKFCPGCNTQKPLEEFNFKVKRRGTRQARCRHCTRLQLKHHYANNHDYYIRKGRKRKRELKKTNRERIIAFLLEHPCVDCGESDVICLDFDHVRGEKFEAVSRMIGYYEWATIEAEISKCEVRCANCHRRKTATQRGLFKGLTFLRARSSTG